jgi:hypothetical protein
VYEKETPGGVNISTKWWTFMLENTKMTKERKRGRKIKANKSAFGCLSKHYREASHPVPVQN